MTKKNKCLTAPDRLSVRFPQKNIGQPTAAAWFNARSARPATSSVDSRPTLLGLNVACQRQA